MPYANLERRRRNNAERWRRIKADPIKHALWKRRARGWMQTYLSKPENREAGRRRSRARYAKKRPEALDAARRYNLERWYGLSEKDYEELLSAQKGVCAICGRTDKHKALGVDHDHETGKIRGLLCLRCNNGLGLFRDGPELLCRAAAYLSRSRDMAVI